MMRGLKWIAAAGLMAYCAPQARAEVVLTEHDAVAYLSSDRLEPGDEATFSDFLSRQRATPLRIVYLNSHGGATKVAMAIGKMIHDRGLATAFHVGHGRCVSACTTMFLGGVQRYYIGGRDVADGIATHVGLGFHPSNGGPQNEDEVLAYYNEMGVPNAASVRYHVYSRSSVTEPTHERNRLKLFFVSGETALKAGVATSLAEPEDPALRDDNERAVP